MNVHFPGKLAAAGAICAAALSCAAGAAAEKDAPRGADEMRVKAFPGKKSDWHGFTCHAFTVDGRDCLAVVPKSPAAGRPWVWRARFWGHEPQADVALLKKGFHVVYMDVVNLYGGPKAVAHWDAFYEHLTGRHGLARKAALEGMSRGGLIVYNWAAKNPEKVNCIYGDAPVCDIKSWPGGKGAGTGSPEDWRRLLKVYGMTAAEAMAFKGNPIDKLAPLAQAGIPILHVCGTADTGVPIAENSDVLERRYERLGGHITVIRKAGVGHHPHSLKDPTLIVNFILESTPGMAARKWCVLRDGLDNSRVRFEKDRSGRVAFLGGSITAAEGWRDLTCAALRRRFPRTEFDFVDAGIPSIDSTGDAFRLARDVFGRGRVDLLFVDASVNDYHNGRKHKERIRAMEGIVRQAREINPAIDIVFLCFIDRAYLEPITAGKTPPVIADHLKVARHYGLVSIDLAKEVTDRIIAGEFAWEKFRDCHPSPYGHRLYARSIERMFDAAWPGEPPADASVKDHRMPRDRLDARSYAHGRLASIDRAKPISGFKLVKSWRPTEEAATREGFVDVPMLTAEAPGAELKLKFTGTAVGLFVVAGPDAGIIEYRIDGARPRRVDQFTAWSGGLHLPWAIMLDADLAAGEHELTLRTTDRKNPKSTGHACRIAHFLVNAPARGPRGRSAEGE